MQTEGKKKVNSSGLGKLAAKNEPAAQTFTDSNSVRTGLVQALQVGDSEQLWTLMQNEVPYHIAYQGH